jgi:glycine/serine hydroxymethyltransferase
MGKAEMVTIAAFIRDAIQYRNDPAKLKGIADGVKSLSEKFPLYRHRLV